MPLLKRGRRFQKFFFYQYMSAPILDIEKMAWYALGISMQERVLVSLAKNAGSRRGDG